MFGLPTDIQHSNDAELKQILHDAIMFQNGIVASLMAKSGVRGLMNYGVSIPDLQRIARQYGTNHSLARRLCPLHIREAKILASLLFDENQLDNSDYESIFASILNVDLAENLARNIICKINSIDFYNQLINSDKWHIVAAIHAIGWAAARQYSYSVNLTIWFAKNMEKIINQNYTEIVRPLVSTICSIGNVQADNTIEGYISQLANSSNEVGQKIYNQLKMQNGDYQ